MKMQEIIAQIKLSEQDTDNWYASREVGLYDLYSDIFEAVEEGYIEGIKIGRPNRGEVRIHCEDGEVYVAKGKDELTYKLYENKKRQSSYHRPASHYERTKAMVYATGNKWAIENFEATHC